MPWNIALPDAEYFDIGDPNMDGLVREIEDQREVAIDTETDGLSTWKCKAYYWSLSWKSGLRTRRICLPHTTLPFFKGAFSDNEKMWVFANAKFDVHMIANRGFEIKGKLVDTSVMHALLYEEMPHGLKEMAYQILGWKWTDFQDSFGSLRKGTCVCGANEKSHKDGGFCKKTGCLVFRQVTALDLLERAAAQSMSQLIDYASNDAYGTWEVYLELKSQLEAEATWSLYPDQWPRIQTLADYFYNLEVPFTRVLYTCERNGMKVDRRFLEDLAPTLSKEADDIRKEIVQLAGYVLNPDSPPQLQKYFYEDLKLPVTKRTNGGKSGIKKPSTDTDFLESIEDDVPMAALILKLRHIQKQLGTYVESLPTKLDPQDRIHARINQDVARCMPAGELVLTSRGYLPVEQVTIGDLVISHTGKPRKVVDHSTHTPKPIWRVKLANGLVLRTTGNHEYKIKEGWVRADALKIGSCVEVHSDQEEWAPITGWPYQVSSWGRVRSCKTGVVLAQQPKGNWGHLKVTLSRNGTQERGEDRRDFAIHRLVIQAFGKGEGQETRHLNGVAWDNTVRNLAYGTALENRRDALRHGTMSQRRAGRTKLTEEDIDFIRSVPIVGQPPSKTAKLSWQRAELIRAEATGAPGENARLAAQHGVSPAAMSALLRGKTYNKSREQNLGFDTKELADRFGVSVGYIREIRSGAKWKSEDYIEGSGATFYHSEVVEIALEPAQPTYGLTVEEDHSHVTGGIVTHNTGRLSAQDGMHQIPTGEKDTWGLRKAFIAEKGKKIIGGDFSQLEMRLLAGASMEEKMCDIFKRRWDIHMGNAALMYGVPYDDIVTAKKIDKAVKEGKSPPETLTEYYLQCLFQRQAAKCVHPDTLVWGAHGPQRIADLGILPIVDEVIPTNKGDTVLSGVGGHVAVTHTYNGGVKRLLHVVTKRGVLTCSENHKLLVKGQGLVRAADLKEGMHPIRAELPALDPGEYKPVKVKYKQNSPTLFMHVSHAHSYLAGLYLGDGTMGGNSLGISHGPDDGVDQLGVPYDEWQFILMDAAKAIGITPTPAHRSVRLGDIQLSRVFEYLELIKNNKRNLRIPSWVLSAGREAVLHFLGGLFDTDGTVSKGSLSVTTKDAIFCGQIAAVLHGLGVKLAVEPSWNKTYGRYYYRIRIATGDSYTFKPYMRHPGKVARLKEQGKVSGLIEDRILKVIDAGLGDCVDITVDSHQHLYVANGYVTHNTIGFGLIYGMREKKLAKSLGITVDEAVASRERYLNTYPAIGSFTEEAVNDAREAGAAYTILGRRRRLPDIWSTHDMDRWAAERQAVNTVIQGSAADTCKMAMLLIYDERLDLKYGCDMLFQVHDEILFECPDEHVAEVKPIIKEWMEHPFPTEMAVPLEVEIGDGPSWGAAK